MPLYAAVRRALLTTRADSIVYLLRALFGTDLAVPLSSPHVCEPGPGSLTLVQTDGQLSTSAGALQFPAQATPTYGDQGFYADSLTRACGRGLFGTFVLGTRSNAFLLIWCKSAKVPTAFSDVADGAFLSGSAAYIAANDGQSTPSLGNLVAATIQQHAVVLRKGDGDVGGAWFFLKGGTFTDWTLLYVSRFDTTTPLFPALSNYASAGSLDDLAAYDIGGAWATPFGAANGIEFPPTGATLTAPAADGLIEVMWTPLASETFELSVRQTDSNNRWIVRCAQAGSTIVLLDENTGTETSRSSVAQTWTAGTRYRIVVTLIGTALATFVETLAGGTTAKNTFTSSFNQAATGVAVAGAVSLLQLAAWPRTIDPTASAAAGVLKAAIDTISITSPQPQQVVQRTGANSGSIAIRGMHNTTDAHDIEARWNGGAYQTIATAVPPGTFSGVLTGLTAGQGTLDVRLKDAISITASVATVGIGDVFLIAGQSNAVGQGTNNQSYTGTAGYFSVFGNDYHAKVGADPVDSSQGQVDSISLDTAHGSVWPLLANSFVASQSVPVMLIPCPLSGSAISVWAPGANHQDRTTLYGSMVFRALQQPGGINAVLWWQGEADALGGQTQAYYFAQITALAAAVLTDLGCKVVPCKFQACSGITDANETAINASIGQAWSTNTSTTLTGPDLTGLSSDDSFHLTSDANLASAAALWWNALQAAFGYA